MERLRRLTAMIMTGAMALSLIFAPILGAQPQEPSPLTPKFRRTREPVKDHYIVVLRDDVDTAHITSIAEEVVSRYRGTIRYTYTGTLKGFAVNMSEAEAERLSRDPRVEYVIEDAVGQLR
jgi:serine protease